MAARTGRSGDGASSSRSLGSGVSERDGRIHVESRAGCATDKGYKINVSGFRGDKEWAKMTNDVAKFCDLGKPAYLVLDRAKLNYPEYRPFLADWFGQDDRMADLARSHQAKRAGGESWTKEMKEKLKKLAADALQLINCTAQEAAAARSVDSPNIINGSGDEGSFFDIDGAIGPEDGVAPKNWPHTKEALGSISPGLPELSLVDIFLDENARLVDENARLVDEKARLVAEIARLVAEKACLVAVNGKLPAMWNEIVRLQAENSELKAIVFQRATGCNCPDITRL